MEGTDIHRVKTGTRQQIGVSKTLPLYTLLMNRGPSPDIDDFPPSRLSPSPAEVFSTSTHRASCAPVLLPAATVFVRVMMTGNRSPSCPVPPSVFPRHPRVPSTLKW